ncbi:MULTISPECIES: streptophobe family protein [unclassified Streptomyces]|uniref:Streptophobe family protein n=1 Tax=Streptomyces thermocoprophilus TaxID=78356 RepID=A0ABV5V8Z9_9ACTN
MSTSNRAGRAAAPTGWVHALVTVVAALASMAATAALGLWAAGADGLPDGGFGPVVAAALVTAVGGALELSGDADVLLGTSAGLTVMPLSVTLVGALVLAAGFRRPFASGGAAGAGDAALWAGRIAVLWLLALIGVAFAARHTFDVPLGDDTLGALGDLLGIAPRVGFRADVPLTVFVGVVWLAGVLLLTVLVSPRVPLPGRAAPVRASVRPAAEALVLLLLGQVVIGAAVALVVAATRDRPAETLAVVLLGLPNVVWLGLTVGLGATWHGHVQGPFDLPMPHVLDQVLRTPDIATLDLGTLTGHDGRWAWLPVVEAVLLVLTGRLTALRSPAPPRPWRHAVHLAAGLLFAVLTICLTGRITAYLSLSVLGIGDLGGGLGGELLLRADVWPALGLAVLWGAAAGLLGALAARLPGLSRDGR